MPPAWQLTLLAWAIRARDCARNASRLARNALAAALPLPSGLSARLRARYEWTDLPVNPAAVLFLLTRVHGHQVFVDGLFNGVRAPTAPTRTTTERSGGCRAQSISDPLAHPPAHTTPPRTATRATCSSWRTAASA